MVTVEICICSACFVKGSNQVVQELNQMIEEEQWQDKISLKGVFCIKSCQNHQGLGVKIKGEHISNVTLANAKEVVKEEILKVLS